MKKALMITLGHNSSALFYDGDRVVGYEQERLDGVKSSSFFPKDAIDRIVTHCDINDSYLFISHWYDSFNLEDIKNSKHIDIEYMNALISRFNLTLMTLSETFTHHDAHAYSALSFLLNFTDIEKLNKIVGDKIHFLVVDGFGNRQEVVSVYSLDKQDLTNEHADLKLIHRDFGYEKSLGLMYQYATSYCGMQENQDEYKFLGYESHIKEVLDDESIGIIDSKVSVFVKEFMEKNVDKDDIIINEDFINVDCLRYTKKSWYDIFDFFMLSIDKHNNGDFESRVIVGYVIQTILESILSAYVDRFNISNLCVSGGVFYNVKLNNKLLKKIDGVYSVIPLAGDQGAAIGFYKKFIGNFDFGDLCYGMRDKFNDDVLKDFMDLKDRVSVFDSKKDTIDKLVYLISDNNIVNFIEGNMEFGPRALCHTSTLALPTSGNVDKINAYNKRNTVMPMAPVMLEDFVDYFYDHDLYSRVIGSDRFMIITYDYKFYDEAYKGVSHIYPDLKGYSGRPQIVNMESTKVVNKVLQSISPISKSLINTSFNVHGNPILFSYEAILNDFRFQCDRAEELGIEKPYLVIYAK